MKRRVHTPTSAAPRAMYAPDPCTPASQPLKDPNTGGSWVDPATAFVTGTSKPLATPHVNLIFWGAWWAGQPLAEKLISSVKGLLAGPYMSYLAQYGVHRGTYRGATYVLDREPGMAFTDDDVGELVKYLIGEDQVPEPDDNGPHVYAVILPANSAYAGAAPIDPQPLPSGTVSQIDGMNFPVAWVDDFPFDNDYDIAPSFWVGNSGDPDPQKSLDFITTTFTHELVEIITDPYGGEGVVKVSPLPIIDGNQIADVGVDWCDYVPNGGRAESYWSIADSALVLPTMYSVRRTLAGKSIGGKLPHTPSTNAWIAGQF